MLIAFAWGTYMSHMLQALGHTEPQIPKLIIMSILKLATKASQPVSQRPEMRQRCMLPLLAVSWLCPGLNYFICAFNSDSASRPAPGN